MELSQFEIWEKWAMLLGSWTVLSVAMWKYIPSTPNEQPVSEQLDEMYRKLEAGLEVRPSKYLK